VSVYGINDSDCFIFGEERKGMKNVSNKFFVSLLTGVLAVSVLAGCQAKEDNNDNSEESVAAASLNELDVDKYVTLGTYNGLEVTLDPITVEDAEVEELMQSAFQNSVTAQVGGITDRAVEMGDTINLDYSGKRDGEVFDGGTAAGQSLGIGSGSFIPGFEEGLVGVMPGETVDVPLNFPEDYWNEDLAGAEVVFTCTVNFIYPTEITDEIVAAMAIEGVSDTEGFRQYVYDYLYSVAESQRATEEESAVLQAFVEGCTFEELPEGLIAEYEDLTRENVEYQASYYGMDGETFISTYYGQTLDEFVAEQAVISLQQDVALQAVANRENLAVSDEELNSNLLEYATQSGLETVEDLIGERSPELYRNYFMTENVLQFLIDNAVVSE